MVALTQNRLSAHYAWFCHGRSHISDFVKSFFFQNIWQTPNQLLRAVYNDIQVPEYLAGCRALGVINKIVTGPLWHLLESSDISITEMNEYYQILVSHIDKCDRICEKPACRENAQVAQCAFLVPQVEDCQSPVFVIFMSKNLSTNYCRSLRRVNITK